MPVLNADRPAEQASHHLGDPDTRVYVLDHGRAEEQPIIRMAHAIIDQGIRLRATEIHIEPRERMVEIEFQVGADVGKTMAIPKHILDPLVRRLKVMADLDPMNPGIAQRGHIQVRTDAQDFGVDVNAVPTSFGVYMGLSISDIWQNLSPA